MSLINDIKLPDTPSTSWTDWGSSQKVGASGKMENPTSTMPVAELSSQQPPAPTFEAPKLPDNSFSSQLSNIEAQAKAIQGMVSERAVAEEGATPQETSQNTLSPRDQVLQDYLNISTNDLSDDKNELREQYQLQEKEARSRELGNRVIERDNYYRDRIEAMEKNPDGKLRGALDADIANEQRMRSREIADLSFAYNIALGDYESAEGIVNQRIADMEADMERDMNILSTAYQFMGDDLTESEKAQIDAMVQEKRDAKQHEYNLEITHLNDKLARDRATTAFNRANMGNSTSFGLSPNEAVRAVDSIKTLDGLANHEGLKKAVGASKLARWTPFKVDKMDGDVASFIGQVDEFLNILTIDTYAEAKERGMTFGAMSEGEWKILRESASQIGSWRRTKEKDGQVITTHYEVDEDRFLEEVDKINYRKKLNYVLGGGNPADIGAVLDDEGRYIVPYGKGARVLEAYPES